MVKGFTGDRKSGIRAHLFRQFELKAFRLVLHVEYFGGNFCAMTLRNMFSNPGTFRIKNSTLVGEP